MGEIIRLNNHSTRCCNNKILFTFKIYTIQLTVKQVLNICKVDVIITKTMLYFVGLAASVANFCLHDSNLFAKALVWVL